MHGDDVPVSTMVAISRLDGPVLTNSNIEVSLRVDLGYRGRSLSLYFFVSALASLSPPGSCLFDETKNKIVRSFEDYKKAVAGRLHTRATCVSHIFTVGPP